MKHVTVEGEVILVAIQVRSARAQGACGVAPVPDISDLVPFDCDVVSVTISTNAIYAGIFDHEPLDHDVRGITQVKVCPGAITAEGALRSGGGIKNSSATVLGHYGDRASDNACISHRDHGAAAIRLSDL